MPTKENARLIVRAVHVFGDVDRAETWLTAPNTSLDGQTPLEALNSADGAAIVNRQLDRDANDSA